MSPSDLNRLGIELNILSGLLLAPQVIGERRLRLAQARVERWLNRLLATVTLTPSIVAGDTRTLFAGVSGAYATLLVPFGLWSFQASLPMSFAYAIAAWHAFSLGGLVSAYYFASGSLPQPSVPQTVAAFFVLPTQVLRSIVMSVAVLMALVALGIGFGSDAVRLSGRSNRVSSDLARMKRSVRLTAAPLRMIAAGVLHPWVGLLTAVLNRLVRDFESEHALVWWLMVVGLLLFVGGNALQLAALPV